MAQSTSAVSKGSLLKQMINFTNSTVGLDLILRLFHSLALIGTGLGFGNTTLTRCSIAASQIGLGEFDLVVLPWQSCSDFVYSETLSPLLWVS